jgi:hypothetical protein
VQDGSLFEATGYINPVHYYPKLYETIRLPLAYLIEPSYQTSLGVLLLFSVFAMHFWTYMRWHFDASLGSLLATLVITTPAIAYVWLQAKGDIFALFSLNVAFIYYSLYCKDRNSNNVRG